MVRDTLKEIEKCEDPPILVKSHIERAILYKKLWDLIDNRGKLEMRLKK